MRNINIYYNVHNNIYKLMCCIIYYIYLRCKVKWHAYITEQRKKEEEVLYNARQLNEYVRNKERTLGLSPTYAP